MFPLLIFKSFTARDDFCRKLGFAVRETPARHVEECYVEEYVFLERPNRGLNVSVPRARDGTQGFCALVAKLCARFSGHIFVFHGDLPRQVWRGNARVNPSVTEYATVLDLQLNDAQRSFLLNFESPQHRQRSPPRQLVYNNPAFDLDDIFRADPNNNTVDADDLEVAIRNSLQDEEARQRESSKRVRPLDDEWQAVLKTSEPIVPGQPVCMVCMESRASICFIPCGHLVTCDDCVRVMKTKTDLCATCIVCRSELTSILRPVLSALAPESAPEKKRRICKKE